MTLEQLNNEELARIEYLLAFYDQPKAEDLQLICPNGVRPDTVREFLVPLRERRLDLFLLGARPPRKTPIRIEAGKTTISSTFQYKDHQYKNLGTLGAPDGYLKVEKTVGQITFISLNTVVEQHQDPTIAEYPQLSELKVGDKFRYDGVHYTLLGDSDVPGMKKAEDKHGHTALFTKDANVRLLKDHET